LLLEMMMELRHIRYFLAVAEERHFTRAAAKIGIGQPPLSQQIKDLEAEIGAPLFHRVAHGAELTSAGEAFLQAVKEMPTLAERATKAARRAARGETGSLRLGYTPSATFNAAVPSAIRAFRRAYPEVDLTLEEANTTPLVTGLREGTLDAVFVRPGTSGTEELQLRRLSDDPIVVALPKRHSAAALKEIDLAILKGDPFLLFPREIAPADPRKHAGIALNLEFEIGVEQGGNLGQIPATADASRSFCAIADVTLMAHHLSPRSDEPSEKPRLKTRVVDGP
jgi:DNA-binding transcriptional LysR family regulator